MEASSPLSLKEELSPLSLNSKCTKLAHESASPLHSEQWKELHLISLKQ